MAAVNDKNKTERGRVKYHAIRRGVVGEPTNQSQAAPCERYEIYCMRQIA